MTGVCVRGGSSAAQPPLFSFLLMHSRCHSVAQRRNLNATQPFGGLFKQQISHSLRSIEMTCVFVRGKVAAAQPQLYTHPMLCLLALNTARHSCESRYLLHNRSKFFYFFFVFSKIIFTFVLNYERKNRHINR